MVGESNSKRHPIHPVYQALCQEHMKHMTLAFLQAGPTASTPEGQYKMIQDLRLFADYTAEKYPIPETIRAKQEVVGGPKKMKIGTTVFRPLGTEDEVLPVILYCHGGGWLLGSAKTHAKIATELAIKAHAAVMLVEYTLAPEVQFPIANEQTYAALDWLYEHGDSIKVNPEQLVIAGDSAGGNMAAVVSMMAKDRQKLKDVIKAQILMYPAVAADTKDYESYNLYGAGDCYLSTQEAHLCASAYFPQPPTELKDPYATPLIATPEQMKGLPPTLIVTAECDILRDEGEAYASKLLAAGVEAVGMRVQGTVHGFMSTPLPDTPQYKASLKAICGFIEDHISQPTSTPTTSNK